MRQRPQWQSSQSSLCTRTPSTRQHASAAATGAAPALSSTHGDGASAASACTSTCPLPPPAQRPRRQQAWPPGRIPPPLPLLAALVVLLLAAPAPLPSPAAAAAAVPPSPASLVAVTNAATVNATTTSTSSSSSSSGAGSTGSGLPTKWTFLVYMLADNNLECFGILDLIEMMGGMAVEPSECTTTTCGGSCPAGYVTTRRASCTGGQVVSRCCASAPFPDVLVLADRGVSACSFSTDPSSGLDYSLLEATWTSAREISVLPGGTLQVERDYGELDLASPDTLSAFLARAWARFPPSVVPAGTSGRKYALVFWDHGNGWKGYGVDDTCSSGGAFNPAGCDQFSLATLAKGLAAGMAATGAPSGGKLDLLGFDACLMSMYEVGAALSPYSRTLLSSELLEPGHGWDYGALGAMTKAVGAGGVAAAGAAAAAAANLTTSAATAAAMSEEAAVAAIWISRYKAQSVQYGTTGITLAAADLSAVSEQLVPAVAALASALTAALTAAGAGGAANASAVAGSLLRRRTGMATMGPGEQDSSVDVGSMLTELLASSDLDAASRAAAVAASAAYNATVLVYGKDESLPRGTGLSIYFPIQAAAMDSGYGKLSTADPSGPLAAATAAWAAFLAQLYNASSYSAATSTFAFVQSAASVPYLDSGSGSYVLQGVLNSQNALSAQLYYGFVDATKKYYALAGSLPAVVDGTRVVGTWRRLLWGVTQSISAAAATNSTTNPTTTATNSSTTTTATTTSLTASAAATGSTTSPTATTATTSALMFVSEEWATAGGGSTAVSVSLTANVLYGGSCAAARADMSVAVLKYTYRFGTNRSSLQLFAQQASGAYGEVSAQAGGVILPLMYKLPRDFSGAQSSTYEYSGCLKWGYNGTVRVAAVSLAAGADSLGVDLDSELLMLLQARDVSQTKTAYLVAPFATSASADTTAGGCQCLASWRYLNGPTSYAGCANPDDDAGGPWCPVLPGSCSNPGGARGAVNASSPWDYCNPLRTLSGCACSSKYPTDATNSTYVYGKCYRADARAAARGAWCAVNASTCPSPYRAHGSNDTSYDYCEIATLEGCACRNSWSYNGVTYNGTCATGFGAASPPEGFTNTSRWCRVRPGCSTRNQFGGYRIGLCAPAVPRVTLSSPSATCALPATLPGGVPAYDCLSWRNGPAASDRAEPLAAASCPLDAAASTYGTCAVRNCTALDTSACPAALPTAGQSVSSLLSSGWLSRPCLTQLCAAALVAGDAGSCAADGARAGGAFAALNASAAATSVLAASYSAASLDSFCAATRGADCLTSTLLPACPAVRLNGSSSTAYDTAYVDDAAGTAALCRADCVRALCVVAGTKCARAALVESLRLSLLEAMDAKCGSGSSGSAALSLAKPAMLGCAELLAPAQSCAGAAVLSAASGNVSLGPAAGTSPPQYAPLTNCTWLIQPPGLPYIQLSFSYFSTEPLYDTLLVEDGDGVLAVLSGGGGAGDALPDVLYTDTGMLRLTFTSDSSLQRSGFAASYVANTTRVVPLPTCGTRQKLLSLAMRTAAYGNEASWVLVGFRVVSTSATSSSSSSSNSSTSTSTSTSSASSGSSSSSSSSSVVTQQVMLAAGGQLPPAVYSYFSPSDAALVVTDTSYRSSRSYMSYVCVPNGVAVLYMYDSYGDGWSGGSLAVSYIKNGTTAAGAAASSYQLVNTTVRAANASAVINVFATMPATAAAYSAALAANLGGGPYTLQATLRLAGETSGAAGVTQTKQLILRGALSAQLGVDITAVAIKSLDAAASSSSSSTSSTTTGRRRRQLHDGQDALAPHDGAGGSQLDDDDDSDDVEFIMENEEDDGEHGGVEAGLEVEVEERQGAALADGSAAAAAAAAAALSAGAAHGAATAGSALPPGPRGGAHTHERDRVPGPHPRQGAGPDGEAEAEGQAATVAAAAQPALVLDGNGDAVAAAEVAQEEEEEEKEEEGPPAHEPGVVEALLESARALGLTPLTAPEEAPAAAAGPPGGGGVRQRRRHQRRRREVLGLQELLADGSVAGQSLESLVSVTQPEFLWRPAAAAAAAAAAATEADSVAGAGAAQAKLPSGATTGSTGNGGGGGGGGGGDSSLLVLPNGLVLAPDGVPVVLSKAPPADGGAAAAAADVENGGAAVQRVLFAHGGAAGGGELASVGWSGAAAVGGATAAAAVGDGGASAVALPPGEVTEPAAAGTAAAAATVAAMDSLGALVGGMRAHTAAAAAGHARRRNGGRSQVPRLRQLLPALLREGAPHVATLIALSSAASLEPTAAADGSGGGGGGGGGDGDGKGGAAAAGAAAGEAGEADAAVMEGNSDGGGKGGGADEAQREGQVQPAPPARRQRQRRRAQASSSPLGVDVVFHVLGYSSQAEAEAASSTLQSALKSGGLQSTLSDAGWTGASASLTGSPTVLSSSPTATPSSGGGGVNWKMLAIIIGASVGGAVLAAATLWGLIAYLRRRKAAAAAEEGGAKKAGGAVPAGKAATAAASAAGGAKSFNAGDGGWGSAAAWNGGGAAGASAAAAAGGGGYGGGGRMGSVTAGGRAASVSAGGGYAGGMAGWGAFGAAAAGFQAAGRASTGGGYAGGGGGGRAGSVTAGGGRAGSVSAGAGYAHGRAGSVTAGGGGGGRTGSVTARGGSVTSAVVSRAASHASHKSNKVVPEEVMAKLYYNQRMGAAAAAARMHANATAAAAGAVAAGQMQGPRSDAAAAAALAAAAAGGNPMAQQQLAVNAAVAQAAAQRSAQSVGSWMAAPAAMPAAGAYGTTPVMPMYDPVAAASMMGPRMGAGLPYTSVQSMMDPSMAAAAAAMDPYGMYGADPYNMYGDPYAAMMFDPYMYGMYGDPYAGMPAGAWGAGGGHPGVPPGVPQQGWQ